MKKIILSSILFISFFTSFGQVGIGTITPNTSAALDIDVSDKALLLPRLANTAAVATPTEGMIIYDISSNCMKAYENGAWSACGFVSVSSGGSAKVSAYVCNTASAGTMTQGVPVTGVTQTITATVTTAGTYLIYATANGVTFSASGTFSGTGSQAIVLTAAGTPTATGSNSFVLNTTPGCNFSRTTL